MKQSTKLILDIVMGAVIPILVLNYATEPLGAPLAYLISALIPVAWVFIDLFLITKRFNVITSYIGLSAIVRGALAFWFVDGALFAFKDSASFLVSVLVFVISVLVGRPFMKYFVAQALGPDTAQREAALNRLLDQPDIWRTLIGGTWILALANGAGGIANYLLNLNIVVAPFGSTEFNLQVAEVNAITRIALAIPETIIFAGAIWYVYRAIYKNLPQEEGKEKLESDFWELMRLREQAAKEAEEVGLQKRSML
jgi:hypothetical protein